MKRIFILACFVATTHNMLGQSKICEEKLEEAEELYKQGKIEEVAAKLEEANCIGEEDNFEKKDKITAYKLLTNTHLYYNEKAKAIESMEQFLTYDTEYKLDTSQNGDSPEFKALYNEFRTHPIYFYGIIAGFNYSVPYPIKRYSLDNDNSINQTYKGQQGLHIGLIADFTLGKAWYLSPSVIYSNKKYSYESKNVLGYANINYTETQSYIDIPIVLKKYFGNRKVRTFLQAGVTLDIMLTAKADIIREDVLGGDGESSRRIEGTDLNMKPQRTTLNYAASVGGGLKIDHFIGKSNLLIDLRYHFNLNNRVKQNNRVNEPSYVYDYLHIDDDFRMDYLQLSLAYVIPKFSPLHYPSKESKKKPKKKDTAKSESGSVKDVIENDQNENTK